MSHFLIVGLGNLPYPMTRHSVGHVILDSLASRLGTSFVSDRAIRGFKATKSNIIIGNRTVSLTLYKPKALMNISGPPVVHAMRTISASKSETIVIHDSLSHKPMSISPRFGGSANGHNGVRSIIGALSGTVDNTEFHRLRIGIGRGETDQASYVLSPLTRSEREFWGPSGEGTDLVWKELSNIIAAPR